jgi:hypothetical protein
MASQPEPDLPPIVVERRSANRRRVLFAGKVAFRDGSQYFDCRIHDMSQFGARITVAKPHVIPTRVYLIDLRTGIAYESEVTRIKPPQYALKFEGAIPLEGLGDPFLQFLKRIWQSAR